MRIGWTPTRAQSSDYHPAKVTICLLVHIPTQTGYFAHRFDVLKICIQSILKNTSGDYDLFVFDNGSCSEVVAYLTSLRDQGTIKYLMLSAENIGIYGALKLMFNAAPGEIIAYSQDDVLFYPGWLEAQLKILETFPKVGLVSGIAVREQFRYGNKYLPDYCANYQDVTVEQGHFVPDEWERDFFVSTGRDADATLVSTKNTYKDILLEYKGVKAYSTAVHFQYVAYKELILEGLNKKWDSRLMEGPDGEIDERIDALGYARLSTFERYVRHIGNLVTSEFEESIVALDLKKDVKVMNAPKPLLATLAQKGFVKRILSKINNRIYFLLNCQIKK